MSRDDALRRRHTMSETDIRKHFIDILKRSSIDRSFEWYNKHTYVYGLRQFEDICRRKERVATLGIWGSFHKAILALL